MKTKLKPLIQGKANQEIFSATLMELAEKDNNIYVLTSDSRGSGKLGPYAERFPDQIVEIGIAEQDLVGVAAGMSSTDKKVFAVSPACFLTARSLEQIKNDIAYSDFPVTLVGISAGVSYGALGSTHHSTHDVAVMRAINNVNIVIPADNFETKHAVVAAAKSQTPVYLKLGKKAMPDLPRREENFTVGKASVICEGSDIVFIACGETVAPAYEAALLLEERGLNAGVISMHTIRPLDEDMIIDTASKYKAMITVEEHSIHGGLGEACSSLLMQKGIYLPFKILGLPDEYTVTGSQVEIFRHYGISGEGLLKEALGLLD